MYVVSCDLSLPAAAFFACLVILPVHLWHCVPAALCGFCNRKSWRARLVKLQVSITGKSPETIERLLTLPFFPNPPGNTSHYFTFRHLESSGTKGRQSCGSSSFVAGGWRDGDVNIWACLSSLQAFIQSHQHMALTYSLDVIPALIWHWRPRVLHPIPAVKVQEQSLLGSYNLCLMPASFCPLLLSLNITHAKVSNSPGRYQTLQGSPGFSFSIPQIHAFLQSLEFLQGWLQWEEPTSQTRLSLQEGPVTQCSACNSHLCHELT